ncbi:MAG: hypothetical protein ABSA17_03910 [Rhabdochlamydiaceae bacterium]|jgi:hypothetical protein
MTDRADDVTKLDPLRRVGDEQKTTTQAPGKGFESYMEKAGEQMPMQGTGKPGALSPFDLAQAQSPLATGPTFDSLLSQVKSSQVMLGDMNNDLHTKNLKLKQSQKTVLKSKLQNANGYLKAANTKMGAQTPAAPQSQQGTGGGIMGKFLNYIGDGQANLAAAQQQLMNLKGKGDALKPADFLAIQVKLAHAQQEIEYASIMLSKAVDDFKTLMNIQL